MHWVSAIQVRSYPVWFFPSLRITRVTILALAKAATFSSQKKSCDFYHVIITNTIQLLRYAWVYIYMNWWKPFATIWSHVNWRYMNGTSSFAPTCCCCFANWLLGCWNFVVAESWVGPHSCSIQFPQCLIPLWRSLAPEATFLQYGIFLVKADCISSSQMVIFFMENPQVYLMVPWN